MSKIEGPASDNSPGLSLSTRRPLPFQPSGRRLVVWLVSTRWALWLVRQRTRVRRLIESGASTSTPSWWPPPVSATAHSARTLTTPTPTLSLTLGLAAIRARSATALVHTRSAFEHFLPASSENCLERLDPVVSRLQKQVLHDGLGALELRNQHLCMCAAGHLAADLGDHAIAARPMEDDDNSPFPRLHEIRGPGALTFGHPRSTSASPAPAAHAFPSCHSFGCLPESRLRIHAERRAA